jgi:flagellar biogenesis protein FliO
VLIRFAAIFCMLVWLVGNASGQNTPRNNNQNGHTESDSLARSDVPALRDTAASYAPITLRGPSTSLSQHATRTDSGDLLSPEHSTDAESGKSAIGRPANLAEGEARRSMATPLVTIASSLALVLGLFAALVWVSKKAQRNQRISRHIPDEVLRVLGQKHLGSLGTISIVRCGRTVMIVSQSASGLNSLATITDEAEVRHLEAVCLGESAASFQAALGEIEREPVGRGFLGEGISQPNARKKLFKQA